MELENKRGNRLLTKEAYMKLNDLLKVMDDITQLNIYSIKNLKEPMHITDISKIPFNLLNWQVDYIGAQCEDVLSVFLIESC